MQRKLKNTAIPALILVLALLAPTAMADEPAVCEIVGGNQYSGLADALAAVQNGQTIRLLAGISYEDTITISGKSVTFDLNGMKLDVAMPLGAWSPGLHVKDGGELKLQANGEFNINGSCCGVFVEEGCVATVTNSRAVRSDGQAVVVRGGELTVTGEVLGMDVGAGVSDGGKLTVGAITRPSFIGEDGEPVYQGAYIVFNEASLSAEPDIMALWQSDFTTPTTKAGYLTYTDGSNVVWVKEPGADPNLEKIVIIMKIGDPKMRVNGNEVVIDPPDGITAPQIIEGNRTAVPIRAIVEAMGGSVGFDDSTKQITLSLGGHTVLMWLGQKTLVADGVYSEMDVAPLVLNGRTLVPVRFAAENLGCSVERLGETNEARITFPR